MRGDKGFTGIGFRRGLHSFNVFNDMYAAGVGWKIFYSSFDAFFLRIVTYTTARIWGF